MNLNIAVRGATCEVRRATTCRGRDAIFHPFGGFGGRCNRLYAHLAPRTAHLAREILG